MKLAVGLSMILFASDALAWGLQTHVYFAQYAIVAAAFADADLRRAVARFPRLVLAGACLPDLSLVGQVLRTPAFRRSHQWSSLRRLGTATCDEERAIAIGYASHLLADVVAHNEFVPEHERRITNIRHATHVVCEWAMDDYVLRQVPEQPGELLAAERKAAAAAVARGFRCPEALALRAIDALALADRALRASPLPRWSRLLVKQFDRDLAPRFENYLRETFARLNRIEALLDGAQPDREPEPDSGELERVRREHGRLPPAQLI